MGVALPFFVLHESSVARYLKNARFYSGTA